MFGYFSTTVQRCPNLMQNPYYVYDITLLEWDRRTVIEHEGKVYLVKNTIVNNYEVICKRDLCYIIVIYTRDNCDSAREAYMQCKNLINELEKSIPWLHKNNTVAIYKEILISIQLNPNWTGTHVAARIGLDIYILNNQNLAEDINRQVLPDLMTPLHLAIQYCNLTTVKAIIDFNPNMNICDANGLCVLHFAAISSPEVLLYIISLPGMFDRLKWRTKKGCTPLHLSCYSNKLENVYILFRFGLTIEMLNVVPPNTNNENVANSIAEKNKDVLIKFTDKEIDEFETDLIPCGGTPLHWTRRQSQVERFLELGFDIDARNLKGDTALISKTKKMRFKCLMCLLCNNANVNAKNTASNTALYYAVKNGDITLTQALVVFDADIDHCNRHKESIRHTAAITEGDNNHKMVLYVLSSLGAKRCHPGMAKCNNGCSHNGNFDGKRYIKWPIFSSDKFYRNAYMKETLHEAKKKLHTKQKFKPINMVGFDGGGVKGLITIQMLHDLQKRLKHNFIDYFDWVSGTSTGSIVAVCLLVGKTTTQLRSIYFRFKDKVMTGKRPYSTELIEKLLQDEIGKDVKMKDLFEVNKKFALIPATLIDRVPVQLHMFRSYPIEELCPNIKKHISSEQFAPLASYSDQLAWKAVRASCAAPTYFNACGQFVDGGIVANNPTMDMLVEFCRYNYALRARKHFKDMRRIQTVLSFGTGLCTPKSYSLPELSKFISWNFKEINNNVNYVKDMFNIIIDAACNSDYHVIDRIESWCYTNGLPFFRLNPNLLEIMAMNETQDAEIVNSLWLTKVYMYSKKDAIDELVQFLEYSYNEMHNLKNDHNVSKSSLSVKKSDRKQSSTSSYSLSANRTDIYSQGSLSPSLTKTSSQNLNNSASTLNVVMSKNSSMSLCPSDSHSDSNMRLGSMQRESSSNVEISSNKPTNEITK